MAKTYEQIRSVGTFIKNTTTAKSVTNQMVGENIEDITDKMMSLDNGLKGYFTTIDSLLLAFPNPQIGWTAWVGSTYPGTVYDVVSGAWHNTTVMPPVEEVNLADYVLKNSGAVYKGIATTTTVPGTPDGNIFYFAYNPGIYSNFSNINMFENEIAILSWNGNWQKQIIGAASSEKLYSMNKNQTYNLSPIWIQGEFNFNPDPIVLNVADIRIKTVLNVKKIKSLSLSNSDYAISAGFIMGKDENLSKSKIKIISNFLDIKSEFESITTFEPMYIMFSIRKTDNSIINPNDGILAGLNIEYYELSKEPITKENIAPGQIGYNQLDCMIFGDETNFVQGEFNFNTDPIVLDSNSQVIKGLFDIRNKNKIILNNTDVYKMRYAFVLGEDLNLSKNKTKILTITSNKILDIPSQIAGITDFVPYYAYVSFSRFDNANISINEKKLLGLQYIPVERDNRVSILKPYLGFDLKPDWELGEFNANLDPIVLNSANIRIRTKLNLSLIKSISINNPNYLFSAYIICNQSNDLSHANTLFGGLRTSTLTLNDKVSIATFEPFYLIVSVKRVDGAIMTANEGNLLNLSVEYFNWKDLAPITNNKIICWGDSLTAGDGVGVYPNELQTLLGSDYSVINQGVGGENVPTILGRLGSEPMYAPIAYTLPATLDSVLIADGTIGSYLFNSYNNQQDCFPLLQEGSTRINPCYVSGVECTLYREIISGGSSTNPAQNKWYIKRNIIGNAINVPLGEPIIMQASKNYRNPKAAILWIGTNGGFADSTDLVNRLLNAKSFINTDDVIIVNRHTIVDNTTDNLLIKTFGCRFFNWRRYVSTMALAQNGITPTTNETLTQTQIANGVKSDVRCMAEGLLPSSLWRRAYRDASDPLNDTGANESSIDRTHMNKKGYQILASKLKEIIINLGL
jgi:hypothetical protein